jgi:hypothetical protein
VRAASTCAALAALVVLALAGCGGSDALTRAQVVSFASHVNLRESDVPGAVMDAGEGESRYEAKLAPLGRALHCVGVSTPAAPPGQASASYRASSPVVSVEGGGFVTSTVTAVPGPSSRAKSAARARLAALASPRWTACERRYGSQSFLSAHPHAQVSSGAVPVRVPPGVITRRTRFSYTRPEITYVPAGEGGEVRAIPRVHRITRYADVLAFQAGRALVEVEATSLTNPPSAEAERRVLEAVRSRVGAGEL